ncbi:MAG: glycosyltransferase family 4 protein, partial [Micromonosporaceae bacterium]|nr:glycosyltransferase family 4 protein [Micromonosporaceae bacterium]
MSRPRIAFCYRYGLLGGVSAQLLNRYPYLSREYDVTILYESDYGMATRFPAGVARVTPTEASIVAALREIKPDITVVIDSPIFLDAWRNAGAPGRLVLEVHTTTANLTYLHHRDQLEGVAHIVTVSSYMEKLLGMYGLAGLAPITVVPNCLDDRWRQPAPAEQLDGAPVLWVGKLDGHKRWRRALDIMDDLASTVSDVRVLPIVVGGLTANNTEVEALTTRLASSPGLANAVWLPRVEYDRMPALYTSAGLSGGVHLCTTSNESFGMAVAESLVCGCPVVAPAVGALPELLPSAALYRPGDWAEAREKARRALSDTAYREELLSTADRVRELTTPKRVLDAYREVVSAVLNSSPPSVRVPEPARSVEQIVLPSPAASDTPASSPSSTPAASTTPAAGPAVPAQAAPAQAAPAQAAPAQA